METRKAIKTIIFISYKVIIIAILIMLIYTAGGAVYKFGISIFNERAKDSVSQAVTKSVTIPENPSVKQVAKVLESAGIIEDYKLFYVQAELSYYKKFFVGGTFELRSSMKPTEIMISITEESREKAKLEAEANVK